MYKKDIQVEKNREHLCDKAGIRTIKKFFAIMLRRENKEANFVASGTFRQDSSSVVHTCR